MQKFPVTRQICEVLHNAGYAYRNNHVGLFIDVLNTSDITIEQIADLFFDQKASLEEKNWHLQFFRSEDGNVSIHISSCNISTIGLKALDLDKKDLPLAPFSERSLPTPEFQPLESFSTPPFPLNLDEFPSPEFANTQQKLSTSMMQTMQQIMQNQQNALSGVWYPADFEKYYAEHMNEKMPEDHWSGHACTEYFEKMGWYTFKLKEGQKPSDAIRALLQGPSVLDCGNTIQLVRYHALLDYLGDEKFDHRFSQPSNLLRITQALDFHHPLYLFIKTTTNPQSLEIGDECYFAGVPWYGIKHPGGFDQGMHVLYYGDNSDGEQLFIGHGFKKPMTQKEIQAFLLEGYNRDRTPYEEAYAQSFNQPQLFDRSINPNLKRFYTISNQASFYIEGMKEQVLRLNPALLP